MKPRQDMLCHHRHRHVPSRCDPDMSDTLPCRAARLCFVRGPMQLCRTGPLPQVHVDVASFLRPIDSAACVGAGGRALRRWRGEPRRRVRGSCVGGRPRGACGAQRDGIPAGRACICSCCSESQQCAPQEHPPQEYRPDGRGGRRAVRGCFSGAPQRPPCFVCGHERRCDCSRTCGAPLRDTLCGIMLPPGLPLAP